VRALVRTFWIAVILVGLMSVLWIVLLGPAAFVLPNPR